MRDKIYVGVLISERELEHSLGPWKKHKYIKKVGDRYYYKKLEKSAKDLAERSEHEKFNADFYKGWSKSAKQQATEADRKFDEYTEKLNNRRIDKRTRQIYRGLQEEAAESRHKNANDAMNFKRVAERRQKRADVLSRLSSARQSQAERQRTEEKAEKDKKREERRKRIKQKISTIGIRGKNKLDGLIKKVRKKK